MDMNGIETIETIEKIDGRKYNGGKRVGSGMPKGKKTRKVIIKEMELAYIKDRVSAAKDVLVSAQLSLARGLSYLYRIDKDSKGKDKRPELVTAQYEIESYLSGEADEDSYYYITTSKPENNAIDSLLDRTLGKPMQRTEMELSGSVIVLPAELIKKNASPPGTISDSK